MVQPNLGGVLKTARKPNLQSKSHIYVNQYVRAAIYIFTVLTCSVSISGPFLNVSRINQLVA